MITLRLRCWYEGDKIKVGSKYECHDVFAYVIYPDKDPEIIDTKHISFSSNIVTHEGWNWYTISYKGLTAQLVVPGYIPIEHPDIEFSVKYVKSKNDIVDYTDKFKEIFTVYDVFLISWKQFLTEVNNLGKYGKYILTAPKLCGLSNEYDQDWNVLCIDKNTLKATIIKTYYKEEE